MGEKGQGLVLRCDAAAGAFVGLLGGAKLTPASAADLARRLPESRQCVARDSRMCVVRCVYP
jgi:hypothetical protein